MSKTQEIVELMQEYEQLRIAKDDYINHWSRRFFRCWIDGSYNGYEEYKRSIEYITEHKDLTEYHHRKAMRMFVISNFCKFIAREYDCSVSTAQKAIVRSGIDLEHFNNELIDDCMDLIAE
jgi:hypothetical protein